MECSLILLCKLPLSFHRHKNMWGHTASTVAVSGKSRGGGDMRGEGQFDSMCFCILGIFHKELVSLESSVIISSAVLATRNVSKRKPSLWKQGWSL